MNRGDFFVKKSSCASFVADIKICFGGTSEEMFNLKKIKAEMQRVLRNKNSVARGSGSINKVELRWRLRLKDK